MNLFKLNKNRKKVLENKAKVPLSALLNKRKKVNITAAAVLLVLVAVAGQIFLLKYPIKPKAAVTISSSAKTITISSSGCTIDSNVISGCVSGQNIEGYDLTVDGSSAVVTLYGLNHLNNVTIQNGGQLTHDGITKVESDNCDSNGNHSILDDSVAIVSGTDCSNARKKEVNLTVDKKISLATNGTISATGKGYPGGLAQRSGNGPGGSVYASNCGPLNAGGGAGYGNAGGLGGHDSSVKCDGGVEYDGPTYKTPDNLGSGGAGGEWGPGSNGGGRITITADIISVKAGTSITANADDIGASLASKGGGGSGGSVNIKASRFNIETGVNISAEGGNSGSDSTSHSEPGGGGAGGRIAISSCSYSTTTSTVSDLINVNGGVPGAVGGGATAGGVGTRYIENSNDCTPLLKKTILPYQRDGAAMVFNPYSLRDGDVIKVQIDLTNMFKTGEIDDDILKTPLNDSDGADYKNMRYCNPTGTPLGEPTSYPTGAVFSYTPSIVDPPSPTATFTNVSGDEEGDATLTYICKVVTNAQYFNN